MLRRFAAIESLRRFGRLDCMVVPVPLMRLYPGGADEGNAFSTNSPLLQLQRFSAIHAVASRGLPPPRDPLPVAEVVIDPALSPVGGAHPGRYSNSLPDSQGSPTGRAYEGGASPLVTLAGAEQ